jgi:hypothetical protein
MRAVHAAAAVLATLILYYCIKPLVTPPSNWIVCFSWCRCCRSCHSAHIHAPPSWPIHTSSMCAVCKTCTMDHFTTDILPLFTWDQGALLQLQLWIHCFHAPCHVEGSRSVSFNPTSADPATTPPCTPDYRLRSRRHQPYPSKAHMHKHTFQECTHEPEA